MATVTSNVEEICRGLARLTRVGSMDGPGRVKTLAEDINELVAKMVRDRYVNRQQQPDGEPLAKLAPSTLKRKARMGFPSTIGVETGDMLSEENLKGTVVVDPAENSLEMTYGKTDAARNKMDWFTRGRRPRKRRGRKPGRSAQPPRPGYELDDAIRAAIDALVTDSADRVVIDLGGVP